MTPKLSIITINRNNADGLRKTIQSVVSQTEENELEYIIIDGASTDISVDIIKEYVNHPEYGKNIHYWISEPDTGIYNAMNKGILKATGDYCLFLNSGDYLYSNTIISLIKNQLHSYDIISGALEFSDGSHVTPFNKKPTLFQLIDSYIPHPSTFIRTKLLREHPYSEAFKIISDHIFFIEALFFENATYSSLSNIITVFDNSGLSNTNGNLLKDEKNVYLNKTLPLYIIEEYKAFEELKQKNIIKYGTIVNKSKILIFITKVFNKFQLFTNRLSK